MVNLKYLGAIIFIEGSKPEILSRIAQTTTALSRLNIIWSDKDISLASKVKLMRTLILSTFLYACESWTLAAELERRIQVLEKRCYRRLPNVSCKDHVSHVTNEEVRSRIQNASVEHNHGEETETQMVWLYLKILWYGEGNSAGDSERSKKERTTEEEMGRKHRGMDRNWVWRFPEGNRRQGKAERYVYSVICGAPTTVKVKVLRWDEIKGK